MPRLIVSLAVMMLALAGCEPSGSGNQPPRSLGVSSTTAAGLNLKDQNCEYTPPLVVVSGDVQSDEKPPAADFLVSFRVLNGDGTLSQARLARFPSSASTGTSVPFRMALTYQGSPAFECVLDLNWVVATAQV
ncbi:MAG: hypothetical protein ACHQ0J_07770 [Candidatus Dormibacterales bacterium]